MGDVSQKTKILYALGQLGWSILEGIITVWLVWFYFPTANINIPEFIPRKAVFWAFTTIGLITMLGRLVCAVLDPVIAGLSDASRNPKGRRIPYMARAIIPFAALTILTFISPVNGNSPFNVAFLTLTLVLYYVFLTMYVVPYSALLTEISHSSKDRLTLSTYTALTWFLGYIIASAASVVWPVFMKAGISTVNSIRLTFVILTVIAVVFMLIPVLFVKEKALTTSKPVKSNILKIISCVFHNRNFVIFEIFFLAYAIAITVFQSGNVYYVNTLLGFDESAVMYLTAGTGVLAFILYAPVNLLAQKVGKKRLCVMAMIILICAYIFCFMLGKLPLSPILQCIIFVALAGSGFAVFGVLPNAIVADISKDDSIKTGEAKEGMFYAVHMFINKLGQSIAMVTFGSLLLLGHTRTNDIGIRLSGVVSASIAVIALFIFFGYQDVKGENEA